MAWRRNMMEVGVWLANTFSFDTKQKSAAPQSIFVLRNNDLGDLLIVTPLFQALRQQFPQANIVAGVGSWNADVLRHNPYVNEVLSVNAPWKNKFVLDQSLGAALRYIWISDESREIARRKFDIGIDVLGSQLGSLLMMHASIPYRLGVRGYAGGHTSVQQYVEYDDNVHVGQAALGFATLLGSTNLPPNRPQIFLTSEEEQFGRQQWSVRSADQERPFRVVIGPGGGLSEKCWPLENFRGLIQMLQQHGDLEIIVVGGQQDNAPGEQLVAGSNIARNAAGVFSLRETFAVAAAADLVVSNSSMLMHAAAAFQVNTVVVLGPSFESAERHQVQWGYPETCICLGRELDGSQIASPALAYKAACQFLSSVKPRSRSVAENSVETSTSL